MRQMGVETRFLIGDSGFLHDVAIGVPSYWLVRRAAAVAGTIRATTAIAMANAWVGRCVMRVMSAPFRDEAARCDLCCVRASAAGVTPR